MKIHPKEVVNVSFYWDEWTRCVNSGYQRDQYYRFGKFDNCSRQWNDFKIATRAKFRTETEDEAKKMLETTYFHKKNNVSPTVGVIWDLKDPPSWD